ncbi:MAG: hypothetical protein IT373_26240 [Polyangiaceae bacterium]|nr:hypothetical protein [Polyangiaceae bacterium]
MSETANGKSDRHDYRIWWFAFGYFACYAPYSALAKALSKGLLPGMDKPLAAFALLPANAIASLAGMFVFISAMRWWRYAGSRQVLGLRVPVPGIWTFLSGLCTAGVVATTTLAYTIKGPSIVFMMLLMRGGVLVIAPLVDFVSRRHVRWFSWVSLLLTVAALLVTVLDTRSTDLSTLAKVDVAIYLAGYFVRLRFMSRLAKSDDKDATKRYFVEEQMVATPALLCALVVCALIGGDGVLGDVRYGFTDFWTSGIALHGIAVGLLSQGTGIFGGLILLDRRENSFCVPVNRASSVLAGIVATVLLSLLANQPGLPTAEILAAGLVIVAIVFLTWPVFQARFFPPAAPPGPAAEGAPTEGR